MGAEIIAIFVPLLTLGLVIWFLARMRRQRKPKNQKVDERTRQERAVWAWANILSSAQGPVSSFGVSRVEMELDVHLPGSSPYPAKVTWLVDKESLGFVEQGKELALKVDPLGPDHIYPNGSWAKPMG
jgi:heme/copper-type cytochrome/quinol oxidase subunit 2